MENNHFKFAFLNGNILKILAAIFMACDHIGFMLFPRIIILRILGRLSLPIFAFMIAEGCKYTKNKLRYFLLIFILGALFQVVYYIVDKSFYMGILITFSTSILMIYALMLFKNQLFKENNKLYKKILSGLLFIGSVIGVYFLNKIVEIGYGFFGCILPLFASIFHHDTKGKYENKTLKRIDTIPLSVAMLFVGILILSIIRDNIQFYSFLAVPFLLLYNGSKGKVNMKYFFYIFYPVHLVIIYLIDFLL